MIKKGCGTFDKKWNFQPIVWQKVVKLSNKICLIFGLKTAKENCQKKVYSHGENWKTEKNY